jgi:glycosyltransferase involved in cell wall biosynthesis/SAM-dependent methyltransferase
MLSRLYHHVREIIAGGKSCIPHEQSNESPVVKEVCADGSTFGAEQYADTPIEKDICRDNSSFRTVVFPPDRKLKIILYIGQLGPGGAERQLCNLAVRLHEQGHEVTVLALYSLDGECGHYLHMLTERGIPARVPEPCDLNSLLAKFPYDPEVLKAMPENISSYIFALINELLEIKPDVLHCWLDYCNIVGGLAGLAVKTPRLLVGGRNVNPTYFPLMNQPWFETWYRVLVKSRRVLFVNNSKAGAEDYAKWLGVSAEGTQVIYNGLDFSRFKTFTEEDVRAFRQSHQIDQKAPLIGGVFRLGHEKRPMDFIAVIKRIKEQTGDVRVVLAGIGGLENEIKAQIEKEDLSDTIMLLGKRTRIFRIMKACDLILHTAEVEGTPNVLLEAQYLGVPVVATRAGGTEEVVKDGVTGLLHPIGDVEGLAGSCVKILRDRDYGAKLAEAGRKFVTDTFTLDRMVRNYLEMYYYGTLRKEPGTGYSTGARVSASAISQAADEKPCPHEVSHEMKENTNASAPVNYQEREVSAEILERDVRYAIQIAENWMNKLPGGPSFLRGKAVMDVGPGINFGTAFMFAGYGARIAVTDAYLAPWDENYHHAFYSHLRDVLRKEKPGTDLTLLTRTIEAGRYLPEVISCYKSSLEDLSCIPDNSFDVIFSNAVFEHLADPKKAFEHLARITRPNGLGFHQVDFRDHRDFSKPLEYLLLGKDEFDGVFKSAHGECGSQCRVDEMQRFLEEAGLIVEKFVPSFFAEDSYLDDFIVRLKKAVTSKYRDREKEDLRILSGHFVIRKPSRE